MRERSCRICEAAGDFKTERKEYAKTMLGIHMFVFNSNNLCLKMNKSKIKGYK